MSRSVARGLYSSMVGLDEAHTHQFFGPVNFILRRNVSAMLSSAGALDPCQRVLYSNTWYLATMRHPCLSD